MDAGEVSSDRAGSCRWPLSVRDAGACLCHTALRTSASPVSGVWGKWGRKGEGGGGEKGLKQYSWGVAGGDSKARETRLAECKAARVGII